MQRPVGAAIRDRHVQGLLIPLGSILQVRLPGSGRDRVLKSGTDQPSPDSSSRLATKPRVIVLGPMADNCTPWRSGSPRSVLRVRQTWIAASL